MRLYKYLINIIIQVSNSIFKNIEYTFSNIYYTFSNNNSLFIVMISDLIIIFQIQNIYPKFTQLKRNSNYMDMYVCTQLNSLESEPAHKRLTSSRMQ